jgi:hypothetical protein
MNISLFFISLEWWFLVTIMCDILLITVKTIEIFENILYGEKFERYCVYLNLPITSFMILYLFYKLMFVIKKSKQIYRIRKEVRKEE